MRLRQLCLAGLLGSLLTTAAAEGYALKTVEPGESLGIIAERYNVSTETLMSYNDLPNSLIHPGLVLKIPYIAGTGGVAETAPTPPPGFRTHTLQPGETLSAVIDRFGITLDALVGANPDLSSLDLLPAGIELLIPPREGLVITLEAGDDLMELIAHYGADPIAVARANDIRGPGDLQPGRMLFFPGVAPTYALERLAQVREQENRYIWPLHGRITSYYGRRNLGMGTSNFHRGIDIAAPSGTTITAARSGTVTFAGWSTSGYGNLVKIRHAGGDETWYAHHSRILVSVGQYVRQGEPIALVGSTGISTGPHLHFELYEAGRAVDPLTHLR